MEKVMKIKLVWNGSDFGFPGSDDLIIDLLSNAQRYMRAITTFVDVRKIPSEEELNAHFSDVVGQFIEFMRWANSEVVDPRQVFGIKIKIDSVKGLPKFSLKYQQSEDVTVLYDFRISNKYGVPVDKVLKKLNKSKRSLDSAAVKQTKASAAISHSDVTITEGGRWITEEDKRIIESGKYSYVVNGFINPQTDIAVFQTIDEAKKRLVTFGKDIYITIPDPRKPKSLLPYKYEAITMRLTALLLPGTSQTTPSMPESEAYARDRNQRPFVALKDSGVFYPPAWMSFEEVEAALAESNINTIVVFTEEGTPAPCFFSAETKKLTKVDLSGGNDASVSIKATIADTITPTLREAFNREF